MDVTDDRQTTDNRQTDRRQTDGREIAYREREREFTFANQSAFGGVMALF